MSPPTRKCPSPPCATTGDPPVVTVVIGVRAKFAQNFSLTSVTVTSKGDPSRTFFLAKPTTLEVIGTAKHQQTTGANFRFENVPTDDYSIRADGRDVEGGPVTSSGELPKENVRTGEKPEFARNVMLDRITHGKPKIEFLVPRRQPGATPEVPLPTNLATLLPAEEVRYGLWDNAGVRFDKTDYRYLVEGQKDEQNLVGGDSRRFFIRVTDPDRPAHGSIEWGTTTAAGTPVDDTTFLELERRPDGSLISKALMLVTHIEDRPEQLHDGFPGGNLAPKGTDGYRIKFAGPSDRVFALYQGASDSVSTFVPVFRQTKHFRIRVFAVREKKQADGGKFNPNRTEEAIFKDLDLAGLIYARIGVTLATRVSPDDEKADGATRVDKGAWSILVIDPPPGTTGSMITDEALGPLVETYHLEPDVVSVFYATDFTVLKSRHAQGWSNTPQEGARTGLPDLVGLTVIGSGVSHLPPHTLAHELGHHLGDKFDQQPLNPSLPPNDPRQPPISVHFAEPPDVDRPGHRLLEQMCLMIDGPKLPNQFDWDTIQAIRIWDQPDGNGFDWLDAMLASQRYLK